LKKYLNFISVFVLILLTFSGCNFWKSSNQTPSVPEIQNKSSGWANSYNFAQFPNYTNGDVLSLGETSVDEIDDGGYAVAGNVRKVEGSNKADIFLLKVNSNGSGVWVKTFGGNSYEGSSLIKKINDGYIFVCATGSFAEGNEQYALIKFDKDFNVSWERLIKMVKGATFKVYNFNIIQTADEGYAILFDISEDNYPVSAVVKINKTGGMEWEKDFKEHIASMDSDKSNIVLLTETNLTNFSFSVLRLDEKGNELWAKSYSLQYYNKAIAIKKSGDGGYFILGLGTYEPSKDGSGIVIVNGKEMFKFPDASGLYRITSFNNGLCVITAEHMAIDPIESLLQLHPDKFPLYGFFVLKIDKDGNNEWAKIFGEDCLYPVYLRYLNPILSMEDGGCVVSFTANPSISLIGGAARDGALVFRLDRMGNITWSRAFGEKHDEIYSSISKANGGFIISGEHTLIKLDEDGNIPGKCNNIFDYKINSKNIDTLVKPVNIATHFSHGFTASLVNLRVGALDLPEVSTICSGE